MCRLNCSVRLAGGIRVLASLQHLLYRHSSLHRLSHRNCKKWVGIIREWELSWVGNFSGWESSGVGIFRVGDCPRVVIVRSVNYPGWEMSWVGFVWGGNCPGWELSGMGIFEAWDLSVFLRFHLHEKKMLEPGMARGIKLTYSKFNATKNTTKKIVATWKRLFYFTSYV